jgi:protein TonB
MELKKSPKADLENKKLSFLLLGLVIMFGVTYIALEWTERDFVKYEGSDSGEIEEVEEIIHTFTETPPPPPPAEVLPPPTPVISEQIEIVDNTQDVGDLNLGSSDDDSNVDLSSMPITVEVEEVIDEAEIFTIVEKMPAFKDGNVNAFLKKNVRYPQIAADMGIQERITVSFVVEKDGSLTDIKVERGNDRSLREEAIRVVKLMADKWTPGEQGGRKVRVKYMLPINFRL